MDLGSSLRIQLVFVGLVGYSSKDWIHRAHWWDAGFQRSPFRRRIQRYIAMCDEEGTSK